ncbi:TetR family transcriptional regulator [Aliirhizobium smilacinae]|uniref:TetR/AcrR family transcriptional regulator n=1 Tax=Aliirhizobium smilacinae TaxID=1395944 RepID=A0A5C4XCC7_9HYPH|nr:TetR family transcriptional regulator [Rhizobium smilacinae]TNM60481.1 TetR/AcrR family transcriptional regulator [Rhizobium smilacinae]
MRKPRRKAEETREDILRIADALFREKGIAKSSIADIAQELGMSPANVFKHFHSKTVLVDAICDRHINHMIGRFDTLDTPAPPPEKLGIIVRRLMQAHLEDIRENTFFLEMIFLVAKTELESGFHYRRLIEDLFFDLIRDGVEAGVYHCADCRATSRYVAASFASVLHPVFLAHETQAELDERLNGLVALANAALQSPLAK